MSKRVSEEIMEAELVNSAQIVLYREGIFVGFECSAYAVSLYVTSSPPKTLRCLAVLRWCQ